MFIYICFYIYIIIIIITQGKAQNFLCITRSSDIHIDLRVPIHQGFQSCFALLQCIFEDQNSSHNYGNHSVPMVHGNVLLISPLSDTTCIFFLPKADLFLFYPSFRKCSRDFCIFSPKCPVLGILPLLLFSKSSVYDLLRSMNSCQPIFTFCLFASV